MFGASPLSPSPETANDGNPDMLQKEMRPKRELLLASLTLSVTTISQWGGTHL